MEARHGRKLTSAAYGIAHDTEPLGRLAPEVSLSRIRGLTCEILAHAPAPSPFQFPLFPYLFLSPSLSSPLLPSFPFLSFPFHSFLLLFNHRLSLLSLDQALSLSSSITNRLSLITDSRCSFLPKPLSHLPSNRSPFSLGWISSSGWHHASDKYLVLVQLGTKLRPSISPSKFE